MIKNKVNTVNKTVKPNCRFTMVDINCVYDFEAINGVLYLDMGNDELNSNINPNEVLHLLTHVNTSSKQISFEDTTVKEVELISLDCDIMELV